MKTFFYTVAFTTVMALAAQAQNLEYLYEDRDGDEVFNISVQITGDTSGVTGLASFGGNLEGLVAAGVDVNGIVFTQSVLSNFNAAFMPQGFVSTPVQSEVGTDGNIFSFGNTQFNGVVVFGIGLDVIEIPDNPAIPTDEPISLLPLALLGTISIPGANGLTDQALQALIVPGGDFFVGSSNTEVGQAVSITADVDRIPEPTSLVLSGIALIGFISRRRRS